MHFKRLPGWAQIICLLAVAFVVTWGFWMALRETLCAIDTKDWLLKRPTRGACFEFWFSRYQTLFSALLAGAIALFVVRPAFRQLRAMNLQTAIGAVKVAEGLAHALDDEVAAVSAIETRLWFCSSLLQDLDVSQLDSADEEELNAATLELDEVEANLPVISTNARRMIGDQYTQVLRNKLLDAVRAHRRRLHTVIGRTRVRVASAAAGAPRPMTVGWQNTVREAERTKILADTMLRDYLVHLRSRSVGQWAIVRRYENLAQDVEV